MRAHGLDTYERVSAVDGKKLCNADLLQNTSWLCRNVLCSRSMIGCALSHLKTWRRIVSKYRHEEGINRWHMVMEDDTMFLSNTIHALRYLANNYLGYPTPYRKEMLVHLVPGIVWGDTNSVIRIEDVCVKPCNSFTVSTACYLLTTDTARVLCRKYCNVLYHIDIVLFNTYQYAHHTCVNIFGNAGVCPDNSSNVSSLSVLPMFDTILRPFPRIRFAMSSTLLCFRTRVEINSYHVILIIACFAFLYLNRFRLMLGTYISIETFVFVLTKYFRRMNHHVANTEKTLCSFHPKTRYGRRRARKFFVILP